MLGNIILGFLFVLTVSISIYLLFINLVKPSKYICSIRRNFFRSTGIFSILVFFLFFTLLSDVFDGKLIGLRLIVFLITLLAALLLFIKGEGTTEKGIIFSLGFHAWDEIQAYSWKTHFNKKNNYLVLRIKNKYGNTFNRSIVVNNKNKEKLEKCFVEKGLNFVDNIFNL